MKRDIGNDHPIRRFFSEALHQSFYDELGVSDDEDVILYLENMLVAFMHDDQIYSVKDHFGQRLESVADMMIEGDVRYNADSFEREREVHKHIGDFVMFWSGLFPEHLLQLKAPGSKDFMLDYTRQGKYSYHVVSTFSHEPYSGEVETFKKLSEAFERYQYGLSLVRASFEGLPNHGWAHGFDA